MSHNSDDLSSVQGSFQQAVMAGDEQAGFLSQIEEGGKIPPEKRLYIYAYAYKARLRETLRTDFPILHAMLGDEQFDQLCNDYIDHFPSRHPSLRFFGQHLEKFMRATAPYSENLMLPEMASFEWLFHDVFDSPDAEAVGVEDVAQIPPDAWTTLRLVFHPSLVTSLHEWNTIAVWKSVNEEDETPEMPQKLLEPATIVQWRKGLISQYRYMPEDEARVLEIARSGKAFPEICEILAEDYGDQAPVKAAEFLKGWILEEMIIHLDHASFL